MDILRLPLAILLLVSGVVMLAAGLIVLWRTSIFLSRAIETDAMLFVREDGSRVFRFFTQDDQRIELAALAGTTRYADGERVRVLYDPKSPENAELKTESNWWLLPALSAIAGFVLLLLGVFNFSNVFR